MTQNIINGKIYKTTGVINLDQIKYWNAIKGNSIYVNANLVDSLYPYNSGHLRLRFKQNLQASC